MQYWGPQHQSRQQECLQKKGTPCPHDQRSPHDSLPLSLYFCRTQGIPLTVQYLQTGRLQPQTMVAGKALAALVVSQNLMVTMSEYRDVLKTDTVVKMTTALSQHLWAQSAKTDQHHLIPTLVHLISPFGPNSPPGLTHVTIIVTCVAGVTQSSNNT